MERLRLTNRLPFKRRETAPSITPVEPQNPLVEKIKSAMDSSPALWRTIPGIARDLGVSDVEVAGILHLDRGNTFITSARRTANGIEVWTTREHFRSVAPLRVKAITALRGTY